VEASSAISIRGWSSWLDDSTASAAVVVGIATPIDVPADSEAMTKAIRAPRTSRDRRGVRDPTGFDTSRHRSATGGFVRPVIASRPMPPVRSGATVAALLLAVACTLTACGTISTTAPAPTPADFQGIATELTTRGIVIDDLVSGDAGCLDPVLIQTAIGVTASGLDQAEPVRLYLYIFRNRASFDRLRATVDSCASEFVTDPETFESIEQSPFVVAGQGPWAPEFEAAVRAALEVAAGTGN
jgi:hypothetical protein